MAETALNFGPEWLRALSHGNSAPTATVSPEVPLSKYKLAQYRYGREEMLALFSKDLKAPDVLKQFDHLLTDKCQLPMAILPITEEEQRIWSRSINSDVVLRSGKGPTGPGNGMLRGGRGGSVDRGRARGGRGGGGSYYQRSLQYDENDDGPPGGFTRLRTLERSQSASEKDQRWDERDRRLDRPFSGRSGLLEDGHAKQDSLRPPSDSWRRNDNDDDNGGWRTANSRGIDKSGGRNTWRMTGERDRMRPDFDSKEKGLSGRDMIPNGPSKTNSNHPKQRTSSGHFWDEDMVGDNLPEWSVEEPTVTDVVGSFDSSGAFLETKVTTEDSFNSDDIFASDDDDCVKKKESSQPKMRLKPKVVPEEVKKVAEKPSIKPPVESKKAETVSREEAFNKPLKQNPKPLYIDKPKEPQVVLSSVPQAAEPSLSMNPELRLPKEAQNKTHVPGIPPPAANIIPGPVEEDDFAHHKKATENMMAQWTEEEEQNVASGGAERSVLPIHHEDAQKWFYRDPQAEIQGPFTSAEMCDWFKAGYFTLNLLVRRGCDERFTQLGELIQTWGRIPFMPGDCPPPLRVLPSKAVPNPPPVVAAAAANPTPTTQPAGQLPQTDAQLRLMQQQLFQQLMQQQMLFRQAQMQQLLVQLKQRESFAKLNPQQQMQAVQQLMAQQQQPQVARTSAGSIPEQPVLEAMPPPTPFPMMGIPMSTLVKNDMSLWNIPTTSGTWPTGQSGAHPPGGSIWDTDSPIQLSVDHAEVEKQKKLAAEEEEKRRQAAEALKKLEEEKRRREEDEKKQKEEAERLLREIQRQQEEEKRRLEEMKRLKEEEEKRRQEELKRLEELKKEEERRLEEIRRQEEKRLEELRKQEEQRKLEEKKQAEREEQRRQELKRLEEAHKMEEKKQEELQRKLKEQERQLEIEKQKAAQRLKEQQALELKLQKDAEQQQEMQRRLLIEKQQKEAERAQQELLQRREAECNQRPPEPKGPAWGVQNAEQPTGELSLSDIQKLQEKKEREEKEKLRQQQQYQQQLFIQQQSLKQAQANKNGLSWAKSRPTDCSGAVKSLAEIQQEEAQKLAQQQLKVQKAAPIAVQTPAVSGVWGNSSQLSRITAPPAWSASNSGFWDDALKSTTPAQKPTKNSDSAFPALSNSAKAAVSNSNKNKNVRAKKDEDAVLKLFETHRKPTDEFTAWCTEALSSLPSSVDVPTFVAFLQDVESPYEVFDYVRSYLGEGKEAKEFGKQFLERRSKFRNQAKQAAAEEIMWGPAPAITPANKPPTVNDSDGTICTKGKAKKKKNRMQKLDNSMLGFTVQPNPDRINVGEIDRVEGM